MPKSKLCNRGKASPDALTKVRLFADSGGYCQNPKCTRLLFIEAEGKRLHIAEIAHIIAAEDTGPRADKALTPEQRGEYDNLILLCPICHTIVDKAAEAFPDSLIRHWKRTHVDKLAATFGTKCYASRAEARAALAPLFGENRAIHQQYGPDNEYRYNPESELADVWQRKVRTRIVPNNRKILALLDANRSLLTVSENGVLEMLRQHVEDLEARHIDADRSGGGSRFPPDAQNLLIDEVADAPWK